MAERDYPVAVAAEGLKGTRAIAGKFSVKPETVRLWRREGAPIAHVGGKYQAEYSALMAWLVAWSKARDLA